MSATQTTKTAAQTTAIVVSELEASIAAFGERIARSSDSREVAQLKSYRAQARRSLQEVAR